MKRLTQRKLRKLIEAEVKGWFKNAKGKDIKLGQLVSDEGIEAMEDAWAGGKNLVDPKDLAKEASGDATPTELAIMKITEQSILKRSKRIKKKIVKLDEKKLRKLMNSIIAENAKVKEFQKLIGMTAELPYGPKSAAREIDVLKSDAEGRGINPEGPDGDWGSDQLKDGTDYAFAGFLANNAAVIKSITDYIGITLTWQTIAQNWATSAPKLGYKPNMDGIIKFVKFVQLKKSGGKDDDPPKQDDGPPQFISTSPVSKEEILEYYGDEIESFAISALDIYNNLDEGIQQEVEIWRQANPYKKKGTDILYSKWLLEKLSDMNTFSPDAKTKSFGEDGYGYSVKKRYVKAKRTANDYSNKSKDSSDSDLATQINQYARWLGSIELSLSELVKALNDLKG